MRRIKIFVLLASVLGWGGVACGDSAPPTETRDVEPVLVKTALAATQTRVLKRRYAGYTHPADASGVGFMVPGRVTSIRVKEGDRIKKGQLIATLDAKDYSLTKQLSDIQVDTLQPNINRLQVLIDKKVLPKTRLETLEGQYEAARTQSRQAERQLSYTRLRAPIGGVVHEVMSAKGQVIAAGSPVVALLDLSSVEVKIGVSQSDLSFFPKGARFDISVVGMKKSFSATVTHVDLVSDVQTRTFGVTLTIGNEDGVLRPSMMASLEVITKETKGIFVPIFAVAENGDGTAVVKTVDPGTQQVKAQQVELGDVFGELVEVEKGLREGEAYILHGQAFVRDGQKVRVQ